MSSLQLCIKLALELCRATALALYDHSFVTSLRYKPSTCVHPNHQTSTLCCMRPPCRALPGSALCLFLLPPCSIQCTLRLVVAPLQLRVAYHHSVTLPNALGPQLLVDACSTPAPIQDYSTAFPQGQRLPLKP